MEPRTSGLIAQRRHDDWSIGRDAFDAALARTIADSLEIREPLTGSEWAERHGILPRGTGAETGQIKLYGYQRGVLDAMCDPTIPMITVMKAARVGYTRMMLLATAYHLEHDPTSCILVQPTITDVEDFSRTEISPMLQQTPALARLIRSQRRGEVRDKITDIFLSNGAILRLRGAASDDAFRRYSARFQGADEIDGDGWTPLGTKSQGDKLNLLWTRGETYWNRKQIRGSTPLIDETSRIQKEFLKSDQRRYFVPCPECGEMQYLEWGGPEVAHGLKWSADDQNRVREVWYVCRHQGCVIDEGHKVEMDAAGEWRPTAKPKREGHVGFHLWTGMSLQPNASWPEIVQEWLDAQADPASLIQNFVNLRLGRTYKLTYGQELKVEKFAARLEAYPAEMPPGVLFLTAGCDVQSGEGKDPRIEVSVYGWGRGAEAWLIGHWILRGDPSQPGVWLLLDEMLRRSFLAIDGRRYPISAACIDSGGHHTAETYEFCAKRDRQVAPRIWAIKGASEQKGRRRAVWPKKPSRGKGGAFYMIGGNAARDFVYKSLAVEQPGARYIHFPSSAIEGSAALDTDWFTQLTRERLMVRKGGFTEWVKPSAAHEAGVCLVYAYAAVCGLQQVDRKFLKAVELGKAVIEAPAPESKPDAEMSQQSAEETAEIPPAPAPEQPVVRAIGEKKKRKRRVVRSSFMGR
jgi:phage terminase large subunit GpA-like protein